MASISKVAIVGAGNMGAGIAQKAAQAGFYVSLADLNKEAAMRGLSKIRETLDAGVRRNIFSEEGVKEILLRINVINTYEELADVDIVIEAVFEDAKVKSEVFRRLDSVCPERTVLATNTSTFSVKEFSEKISRPDRFVGLHFFYHAAMNRLLEIIPGPKTSSQTLEVCQGLANAMDKVAITVGDSPGFAVNRFFVPWVNEAVRLLDEGVPDIPSIDQAAKETFGIGMGPFALMNATGIPIAYHTTTILAKKLSSFYAPTSGLIHQFETGEKWDMNGQASDKGAAAVKDRLAGVVFLIAAYLEEEDVADMTDIDIGAKIGLLWRRGPFEMMNDVGIVQAYHLAKAIVDQHPDLYLPGNLKHQFEMGQRWSIQYVTAEKKGSVAFLTIKRPEAMNALNNTVIAQLSERFDRADNDADVKTIVIGGLGKVFVAGADIGFFIKSIQNNRLDEVEAFANAGHALLNRIEESQKRVIARVNGLALGGGLELALACDTIIASENASFGLPETGIGIYPGFGGMQRSIRKVGKPLAKYLVLTGKVVDSATALDMALIEYVVSADQLNRKTVEVAQSESPISKKNRGRPPLSYDFLEIERLFGDAYIDKLISGDVDEDPLALKLHQTIAKKAPLAVRKANELMDLGENMNLREALELEKDDFRYIFGTKDALEGLLSVVRKEKPIFKGQ